MNEFGIIDSQINVLNNVLDKLTSYLVNEDKYDHDKINEESYKINKSILKLRIRIESLQIKHANDSKILKKINNYNDRTTFFMNTIKNIDDFNNIKDLRAQARSIRILTIINMVALPLAVITGYFGMNFRSMGNPTHTKGILSHLHGQKLVFILFFVSIIVMIIIANNLLT